jgi:hypothetical protein
MTDAALPSSLNETKRTNGTIVNGVVVNDENKDAELARRQLEIWNRAEDTYNGRNGNIY